MPQTIVIESYHEFAARHGGESLHVGNRIVFSDGAYCHPENGEMRYEPPTDPIQRLKLRRTYMDEWLRRCRDGFSRCKHDASLSPSDAMLAELKRLQNMVVNARADWEAIDGELQALIEASPEGQRRKMNAQIDREIADRRAALLREITDVNI